MRSPSPIITTPPFAGRGSLRTGTLDGSSGQGGMVQGISASVLPLILASPSNDEVSGPSVQYSENYSEA